MIMYIMWDNICRTRGKHELKRQRNIKRIKKEEGF